MNGKRAIATALFFVALLVTLVCSIFTLGGQDHPPSAAAHSPLLRVRPSHLLQDVNRRLDRHQFTTINQLIGEANSELARRGSDYVFDVGSFITERQLTPLDQSTPTDFETNPYEFDLTTLQGAQLRLQVDVGPEGECGERATLIPAARVTPQEITVVVGSRRYRVRRPSGFGLERVQLVDEKTKKTLRTWELPFYAELLGVSPDGSTLFFLPNFNFWASQQDTSSWLATASMLMPAGPQVLHRPSHLILAVSERGVQFANEYELVERETSEVLEDRDPNLPYVGYRRFHLGDKSYVVRFQWPCT
jgi:hypothetical protein